MARSLPAADKDAMLGDLSEEFCVLVESRGSDAARRWYWRQTRRSLSPNLLRRVADGLRIGPRPGEATTRSQSLFLEGLMTDLRDAFRALRAAPTFTIVALVVLALGIGASTAIFSVVDAVVLRALPFDQPDRIVAVGERSAPAKGGKPAPAGMPVVPGVDAGDPLALMRVQPQNYLDWIAQQRVFEAIAAIDDSEFTLRTPGGEPDDVAAQRVTASFFDVLRVKPSLGRTFTPDTEVDGRHRVAVLSDAFWRRQYGGNPDIVGRTITLDDGSYEVAGIMGPAFSYPVGAIRQTDLWVPYVVPPNERVRGRGFALYLQAIARLKPGVTIAEAQANMDQIAAAIDQANPSPRGPARTSQFGVRPLRDHLVGASMKSWMMMLLAAVGIVLLIACANVANLLLARASAREREVAVRSALGASRLRIMRQLMVESLVLSIAGTILSIALAWWTVELLRSAMPEGVPRVATIAVDFRVLAAAAGLSIVTGVLFGIVPALQMSRPDLASSLKEGVQTAGRARQRLRGALVVAEIALAVVLLVGAALFIGSFIRLMGIDPGFNPQGVLTMQLYSRTLPGQRPPDWSPAFAQIVERLSQTKGVVNASAVSPGIPLTPRMRIDGLTVPGKPVEGDIGVSIKAVTPDYHRAFRIPLRRGRLFDSTDRQGSQNVLIMSESVARTFLPGEDPVGRAVNLRNVPHTVVGVVADARQWTLEGKSRPEVYVPMAQGETGSGYLVIRTSVDPYEVLPAVKAAALSVLPDVPLRYVTSMEDVVGRQTAQRRLNMLMLGLFGLLGLVISAVGVYGVMTFIVSQRTREIGVRMALGATRRNVIGMVLMNACALVGVGLILGGMGAWYLGATAQVFLFGLDPHDMRAFGAAIAALTIAAIAASAIPARRAAGVDPTVALRGE
jgi:putative ABC transport system permease protein